MREIEWNGKNIAEGECENKGNFKKFKALQRLASLGENKYFCILNSTMEFEKKFISFGPTLNLQKGEDQLKKLILFLTSSELFCGIPGILCISLDLQSPFI